MLKRWKYRHDEIVLSLAEFKVDKQSSSHLETLVPVWKKPVEISDEHTPDKNFLSHNRNLYSKELGVLVERGVVDVKKVNEYHYRDKPKYSLNFENYSRLMWRYACEKILWGEQCKDLAKKEKLIPRRVIEALKPFFAHPMIVYSIVVSRDMRKQAKHKANQMQPSSIQYLTFKMFLSFLANARLYNTQDDNELTGEQWEYVNDQREYIKNTAEKGVRRLAKGRRVSAKAIEEKSKDLSPVDKAGVVFFEELFKGEKLTAKRVKTRGESIYEFLLKTNKELENKKR